MSEPDHTEAALAVIALGVVLAGLVYGRSFLVPLAIAVLLWNLLEAVIERFTQIRIGKFQVPRWFAALEPARHHPLPGILGNDLGYRRHVVMIVCAHISSWRWVAILLSQDGRVDA